MASSALSRLIFLFFAFCFVSADHPRALRHARQLSTRSTAPYAPSNCTTACSYWLEDIAHQGLAPYSGVAGYQVFRNVKDFGAKGDGVSDDTAAINAAISFGNRCGPGTCNSTSTTPALVYFPAGTYVVSSGIIDYYYTQLIGNPNCMPVIKASSTFNGLFVIDGDLQTIPNDQGGNLDFGATNVFWRQIRNFVIDVTAVPVSTVIYGIHWPTGQATSIQNVVFEMSSAQGTQHRGLVIDNGSGGFLTDLVFNGGYLAAYLGNQQFTMRNLTFNNAITAINMRYDWGWTFTGISINNCGLGFNITNGNAVQAVGSILVFDSEITNTPVGVLTTFQAGSKYTNGSVILENIQLTNVQTVVMDSLTGQVLLPGGSYVLAAYGQGHAYTPNGPSQIQGMIAPNDRPSSLQGANGFYQRSKPQYQAQVASQFLSARSAGAKGDGKTDDSAALNQALQTAIAQQKILFLDAGDYLVLSTIRVPAGSVIVGEAYPVIIGAGSFFSQEGAPQPVVQLGQPGDQGSIEWSDAIVSTQGATAGAILFELNLASPAPASGSNVPTKRDAQSGNGWGNWNGWSSTSSSSPSTVSPWTSGTTTTTSPKVCRTMTSTTNVISGTSSSSTLSGATSSLWTTTTTTTGTASTIGTTTTASNTGTVGPTGTGTTSTTSTTTTTSGTGTSTSTTSATTTTTTTTSGTGSVGPTGTGTGTGTSTPTCTATPQPYTPTGPSGLWDVHARIGGFVGSQLQLEECPTTAYAFSPAPEPIDTNCIAAFLTMHITSSAANFYLENNWLWVADHDVDDPDQRQITIYAGRGLLVESTEPLWLWGTAVEHHTLYQYQFANAATVYMGQIQTETAYYQPSPPVLFPFPPNPAYNDPNFAAVCTDTTGFNFTDSPSFKNDCDGYGLRVLDSRDLLVYGAGLYSFFDNYNTTCSAPNNPGGGYGCQNRIFSIEGSNTNLNVYTLNTVGAQSMFDINFVSEASYADNVNVFPDDIALVRIAST